MTKFNKHWPYDKRTLSSLVNKESKQNIRKINQHCLSCKNLMTHVLPYSCVEMVVGSICCRTGYQFVVILEWSATESKLVANLPLKFNKQILIVIGNSVQDITPVIDQSLLLILHPSLVIQHVAILGLSQSLLRS